MLRVCAPTGTHDLTSHVHQPGGEVLVPAPVPVDIMARAWHDIVREEADNASLQAALRILVSAGILCARRSHHSCSSCAGLVGGAVEGGSGV